MTILSVLKSLEQAQLTYRQIAPDICRVYGQIEAARPQLEKVMRSAMSVHRMVEDHQRLEKSILQMPMYPAFTPELRCNFYREPPVRRREPELPRGRTIVRREVTTKPSFVR